MNVAADPAGVLGEVPSIYGMLDEMKAVKNQALINQVKTRIDGMRQSMMDQGMQDVPAEYVRTIGKGGVAGIDYQATMDNLSQTYENHIRDQRLREAWGNDYQNARIGKSRMTVLEFEQRVLDMHQETANKAYDDGVNLMAQGKLPYKSGEYAKVLGNYMDGQVRSQLRDFAKAEGIPDGGPSQIWAINRRLKTEALPEYGIPDSRIGRNLYADTTLARKGTYTEQVQKWNTIQPGHTIIIRPEQLPGPLPGSSGSYVIPRSLIPQYVPVVPKLPLKGGKA